MISKPSCSSVTLWEETAPVKLPTRHCPRACFHSSLEHQTLKGGISRTTPTILAYHLQSLPPILHIKIQCSVSSYSKGPRGLSVLPRVGGIFTSTTISLNLSLRQLPSRYAIHAGRYLTDKEFRYLRTVIVTAAVYRGFDQELRVTANPQTCLLYTSDAADE